jgi:antitoxin HigA-1
MRENTAPLKRGMRPQHPGAILKNTILPELDITQLELANRLGVSRRTISEVLRQRRPVTPDMAMRLARVFNTTAKFWLNLQAAVDLWKLDNVKGKAYAKIVPLPVQTKRKAG